MNRTLLSLTLLLLLLPSVKGVAEVHVVAVGISNYSYDAPLPLAANDAEAFAQVFLTHADAHTILLLNSGASLATVSHTLDSVCASSSKDDAVIFYFAGHGNADGIELFDNLLCFDHIRKAYTKSRSTTKIVFIDACEAGNIRHLGKKPSASPKHRGTTPHPSLTQQQDEKEQRGESKNGSRPAHKTKNNVVLFLATRDQEAAYELSFMKHSLFSDALIRGLSGSADKNHDHCVSVMEIYKYTRARVIAASFFSQHPVVWGSCPADLPVIKLKTK